MLAGWVLSIPVSAWTSKVSAGQWARVKGLFLTPEEVSPPLILKRFREILETTAARPWTTVRDGLSWVLSEPQVRSIHLALLPPPNGPKDSLAENRLEGLRLKARSLGADALLPGEKRELLWDAGSIEALCRDYSSAGNTEEAA